MVQQDLKLSELRTVEQLYVFKQDELAGSIRRTEKGSEFSYTEEYLEQGDQNLVGPLAFHLPLSRVPVVTIADNLHPFFSGLLPEGLRLNALVSVLKTSADDMFSLLAASGADCIGDVAIALENVAIEPVKGELPEDLDSTSFYRLFEQSISADEYRWRLSDGAIPGVNPKISAEMISFPIASKKRNKRYILKLAPKKLERLVENEHFFMKLAKSCGLEVARTDIVHDSNGDPGLLVERFDRQYNRATKKIESLHQEDACQFLNRYPQDKYRLSMKEIAVGITEHASAPLIEIGKLLELKMFSYLIANGDLHAKNISLLHERDSGRISLSPCYDLLSTLPYGDQHMALKLQGRDDNIRAGDFVDFAKQFDLPEAVVTSSLQRISNGIRQGLPRIAEIGFTKKKTEFLVKTITDRLNGL